MIPSLVLTARNDEGTDVRMPDEVSASEAQHLVAGMQPHLSQWLTVNLLTDAPLQNGF